MAGVHVAHRDRRPDGGAEPAAGDVTDRVACRIEDDTAFARRGAAIRAQPDPSAFGTMRELLQDRAAAGKPGLIAAALADRPGETRFDRRRRLVDVVAVEAEP